jgi:hypothetical protein
MMQRAFVSAADIHARLFPDGFEPFELAQLGSIIILRNNSRGGVIFVRHSGIVGHKKGVKKEAGLEPPNGAKKIEKSALPHNPNLPQKPQFFGAQTGLSSS